MAKLDFDPLISALEDMNDVLRMLSHNQRVNAYLLLDRADENLKEMRKLTSTERKEH